VRREGIGEPSRVPDAVQRVAMRRRSGTVPGTGLAKLFKKIVPVRIEFIDQFELPGPPPALERPFARSCFNDRGEFFDVDESRYTIRDTCW